jgi:hypothetical protein
MSITKNQISALVKEKITGDSDGYNPLKMPVFRRFKTYDIDRSRMNYDVSELLIEYDEDLIRVAYLTILKRDVDVIGLKDRLTLLRQGKISRIEILGRLRFSPEGKKHSVTVRNLLFLFLLQLMRDIPVIGIVFSYLKGLYLLGNIDRTVEKLNGSLAASTNRSLDRDNEIVSYYNDSLKDIGLIKNDVSWLKNNINKKSD